MADAASDAPDVHDASRQQSDDVVPLPDGPRDAGDELARTDNDAARDAAIEVGAALNGQRWEIPCTGPSAESERLCSTLGNATSTCPDSYLPVDRTVSFGGEHGRHYATTLRFRGVVELAGYFGGTPLANHFYVGGTPIGGVRNVYGLTVSSPNRTYYLNANAGGGTTGVTMIDNTQTIAIEGGATVRIFSTDSDCMLLRNCMDGAGAMCSPYVVPGVPPAPSAFNGQLIQVNVVSAVPQ